MSLKKENLFRSRAYLDWVKTQPSCISGQPSHDAHHIKGHGGGGTKVSDLETIPLTRTEHTIFHSTGWRSWELKYGDQRGFVVETLREAFKQGILKIEVVG